MTTPATRIAILRPGGGVKPEILAASLFAQLTNDPTLLSLQILSVLLFSILTNASSVLEWRSKRQHAEKAEGVEAGARREQEATQAQKNKPAAPAAPPAEEAEVT